MPAQQAQTFGEVLKRYRGKAGLTQEELAEAAGISLRGLSDLERGSSATPRAATLELLITALKLGSEERADLGAAARRHRGTSPPDPPFVAICHAPEDRAAAERLLGEVQASGLASWLDGHSQKPGTSSREHALRDALRGAQVVLLVVSPSARTSRYVTDALRIAEMYRSTVHPLWVAGESWQECAPPGWGEARYVDLRDGTYANGLHELLTTLLGEYGPMGPATPKESPPSPPSAPPRNPYKGLRAFTDADAQDFFGREHLVSALVAGLHPDVPDVPRLMLVVGPSGSGKSSLIQAGMLPALRAGALTGSERWIYLEPLVPGTHPLEALTMALHAAMPGSSLSAIGTDLEASPRALHLLAGSLAGPGDRHVLLVVDQFEELFSLTATEEERQQFIDLLVAAVSEPRGSVIALLTLRADFFDRPLRYPALVGLLESQSKLIPPMSLAELRAAIEGPAVLADVRVEFESDLVGDLLFEVRGEAGALPLLQFTLDQLFERRAGRRLTIAAYHELGGVRGALGQRAEKTYASLADPGHQRLARALFLRLVDPGESEQNTARRRAAMNELVLPDALQTARMRSVAEAFIAARLLTTSEFAGVTTIEVSHEALIREWTRLAAWLREIRDDIRLQQAISADAAEWLRRGSPADRIYHGTQLDEALRWAERNVPSATERRFLEAGLRVREQQAATEREQQTRELALSHTAALANRRAANRLHYLVGALAAFLLVTTSLAALAVDKARTATANAARADLAREQAQAERTISLSRQLSAQALAHLDNKPDLALLLGVAANDVGGTVEAKDSLLRTLEYHPGLITFLRGHQGSVLSLAFSHNSRLLVSGGADATIRRWDPTSDRQVGTALAGHTGSVFSLALSRDGRWLASAGSDATVRLWNLSETHPSGYTLPNQPASVTDLAFSPAAPLLAYGGSDARIHLWNAAARRIAGPPLTDHRSYVTSVAFSPNGLLLAAGADDGAIQLWDLRQGRPLGARLLGHTGRVTCLSFSPDGAELASGSADTTIRLWHLGGRPVASLRLTGHLDRVTSIALSPDGRSLASGSLDQTVRLWNLADAQPVGETLPGKTGIVNSLAFNPDGRVLAEANADGTIWLRSIAGKPSLGRVLAALTDTVTAVTFSPDGRLLASGGDTTVRLWDVSHMRMRGKPLEGHTNTVTAVAFSPDSHTVAAGSSDLTVRLWDVQSGRTKRRFLVPAADITDLAFSHDGRTLAVARGAGTVQLWDVRDWRVLRQFYVGGGGSSVCIALSPNGRWLAVGSADRAIALWDLRSGRQVALPFAGHTETVNAVAFSPDGRLLASGSADKTVRLWSVATGQQILSPLTGPTDSVTSVVFSPDGSLLASGSLDHTIQLWDVVSGQPVGQPLTGHTDGVNAVAFSPDGQLLASASDDTTIRLWDIGAAAWKQRACHIANRELSSLEWTQYLGNESHHGLCPQNWLHPVSAAPTHVDTTGMRSRHTRRAD